FHYVAHGNVVGVLVTVVGNRAVLVTNTNPQAVAGGRASVDDFTGGRGVNRGAHLVGDVNGGVHGAPAHFETRGQHAAGRDNNVVRGGVESVTGRVTHRATIIARGLTTASTATTVATVNTVAAVGRGVVAPDGDVDVVKVVLGVTTTILHNVRATTDREILLSPNRVLHAVLVGVIQNPVVDFRTQSDLAGVLIIVNHHV